MTVKSPTPQQQQLIWSVTLIQWIVASIVFLRSYAFKEEENLVHQNKCIYLENISLIWK